MIASLSLLPLTYNELIVYLIKLKGWEDDKVAFTLANKIYSFFFFPSWLELVAVYRGSLKVLIFT